MAPKQSLLNRMMAAVGRMSSRERRLVVVTVAVAIVFVFVGGTLFVQARLDKAQRRLGERQGQLQQILGLESQYHEAEQERTRVQEVLARNDVQLFTLLSKVKQELGLPMSDLSERRTPLKESGIDEISVDVDLRQLSIDKLGAFLEKVEDPANKGMVKVLKLKVKTRFDNPELLDVSMKVATYRPTPPAAPAGGPG
ncbi:MAG: type II secretion system protein M [Deltaproteobacteria bacterium]|nr:type II secretion system protein M [Deltaproteobacteria bacterium]